ncbi:unnamed protein product [Absidia cylindrospora]
MTNISQLPFEIIHLIVLYVHKRDRYACTLINKQFHSATNPLLWKRLAIYDEVTLLNITASMAESPHHSLGQHIRFLEFGSFLTDVQFLDIMQHVSHLESIQITNAPHITDISFEHLPRQYPHLTYLCLHESPITRRSIVALGKHCSQLGEINLERCTNLGCDLFSALATWPLLENLTISLCNLNGMNNTLVAEETTLDMIACHGLKHLFIQELPFDFSRCITTTHDRDGNLAWPHLTHLFLNTRSTLNDSQVIAFIQSHPHLEELELTGGTLTDATLDAIAMNLPGILCVGVSGNRRITSGAVRRLVQNCPELASVLLVGCRLPAEDFPEQRRDSSFEWDLDGNSFVAFLDGDAPDMIRQGNHPSEKNNINSS